jgi:hypothetical protein
LYISINLKKMRFQHKHESFQTVANLDYIAGIETNLTSITDPSIFHGYTHQELGLLYRHTTNSDHIPAVGDQLKLVLMELAERFPATDADALEAEQQAFWIELNCGSGSEMHRYVRGAGRPIRTDDMLFPDPVPLSAGDARDAVVKHGQRLQQRASAQAAATPAPSPSAPPAPRKAASRPRTGVCGQRWEVLDNALTPDGVPPSRAQVKDFATQYGWNPSTASVQYAAWRKAKNLP